VIQSVKNNPSEQLMVEQSAHDSKFKDSNPVCHQPREGEYNKKDKNDQDLLSQFIQLYMLGI
jgi:hypothetical protein